MEQWNNRTTITSGIDDWMINFGVDDEGGGDDPNNSSTCYICLIPALAAHEALGEEGEQQREQRESNQNKDGVMAVGQLRFDRLLSLGRSAVGDSGSRIDRSEIFGHHNVLVDYIWSFSSSPSTLTVVASSESKVD